jgi:hypothetical protein
VVRLLLPYIISFLLPTIFIQLLGPSPQAPKSPPSTPSAKSNPTKQPSRSPPPSTASSSNSSSKKARSPKSEQGYALSKLTPKKVVESQPRQLRWRVTPIRPASTSKSPKSRPPRQQEYRSVSYTLSTHRTPPRANSKISASARTRARTPSSVGTWTASTITGLYRRVKQDLLVRASPLASLLRCFTRPNPPLREPSLLPLLAPLPTPVYHSSYFPTSIAAHPSHITYLLLLHIYTPHLTTY